MAAARRGYYGRNSSQKKIQNNLTRQESTFIWVSDESETRREIREWVEPKKIESAFYWLSSLGAGH